MATQDQLKQLESFLAEQQKKIHQLEASINVSNGNRGGSQAKPPKPDIFDGRSVKLIDQWMFEMEQYLRITGTPVDQWVNIGSAYLRGAAAAWWRKLYQESPSTVTWSVFKSSIMLRFRPLEASKTARAALDVLRQSRSVSEYCDAFFRQSQLIDSPSEAELLHCFIRGLKPSIAREVDMFQPKNLQDAMSMATRSDLRYQMFSGPSSRSGSPPSFQRESSAYGRTSTQLSSSGSAPMELGSIDSKEDLNDHVDGENKESPQLLNTNTGYSGNRNRDRNGLSREDYDRLSKERRCFRCRQRGHMARNCSQSALKNNNGTSRSLN